MEEAIISFVLSKLFKNTSLVSDSEYRVRVQHVESYMLELMSRSDDPAISTAMVRKEKNGVFFYSQSGTPDAKKLGQIFSKVSDKYPITSKLPDTITIQADGGGYVRPIVSIDGVMLTISRASLSTNGKWFIIAVMLLFVEAVIFGMFVSNLSLSKDFASVRLYFNSRR
jgi:hypothetical protein